MITVKNASKLKIYLPKLITFILAPEIKSALGRADLRRAVKRLAQVFPEMPDDLRCRFPAA
jgi:hypothetical protein